VALFLILNSQLVPGTTLHMNLITISNHFAKNYSIEKPFYRKTIL